MKSMVVASKGPYKVMGMPLTIKKMSHFRLFFVQIVTAVMSMITQSMLILAKIIQ